MGGEVGQFQFVPSVYYKYAVDFDGDGTRNLITNTADVLASAANYLDGLGWKPGQPWIEEVRVPANLPWDQADVTIKKPRAFWAQHGVTYPSGKPIPADNVQVGLHLPMGRNGPAFHHLSQFRRLSRVEQVAGLFDDRRLLRDAPCRCAAAQPGTRRSRRLSLPELKELQQLLAKRGFDVGKIDGVVGASTRVAIRAMQIKFGLPADGYPSDELLDRMRNG